MLVGALEMPEPGAALILAPREPGGAVTCGAVGIAGVGLVGSDMGPGLEDAGGIVRLDEVGMLAGAKSAIFAGFLGI